MRPRLVRAVYGALGGDLSENDDPITPVCEAVECFHKASLIHDDIQDGDVERYGREALHVKVGIPMAIAVGDWLVAKGYTLIASSGFDASGEMLAAAATSHLRLCEGQAMELSVRESGESPATEKVLEIFALKTGEAFALAAELGAMAAGAGARIVDEARSFALDLGVAFQIDDDLEDGGGLLLKSCGGERSRIAALRQKFVQRAESVIEASLFRESREKITGLILSRNIRLV